MELTWHSTTKKFNVVAAKKTSKNFGCANSNLRTMPIAIFVTNKGKNKHKKLENDDNADTLQRYFYEINNQDIINDYNEYLIQVYRDVESGQITPLYIRFAGGTVRSKVRSRDVFEGVFRRSTESRNYPCIPDISSPLCNPYMRP